MAFFKRKLGREIKHKLGRGIIVGPRLTPIVKKLPSIVPFIAPDEMERARGAPFRARLGANELNFGPSPKAVKAMQNAAKETWKYCDPKSHFLRSELANQHSTPMSNIAIGEGIDGLLSLISTMMVSPYSPIVTTEGTYPTLNYFVEGRGGTIHTVPYDKNDRQDLSMLLSKAKEVDAQFVYVVNPDNPSGTFHSKEKIENFIEALPSGTILILDEAYAELASDLPRIAPDDLRVLRLRTFSKVYGLAGLRVGYAIGAPETMINFDKIRSHFGVNFVGQAGALAALQDEKYLAEVKNRIAEGREMIIEIARENGLKTIESKANFVAVDCGKNAAFARGVLVELSNQGVFVRMPGVAPLNRCIRVSCGTESELKIFREAFPNALEAAEANKF